MLSDLQPSVATALRGSFLHGLPDNLLRETMIGAVLREVPAGRVFISADQPHRWGIVVSGLVRVFAVRPNGAEVTLLRVGTGAAVGVRAVARRHSRITAQGVTDCEFLQLSADQLLRLGAAHVAVGWAVAQEIDRQLEATQYQFEAAAAGSVLQRLAGLLLDVSVEGQPLEVEITQEEIAERTGSSREAVGRELRRLHGEGIVAVARGRVLVRDALHLQAVAVDYANRRRMRHTPQRNET